MADMFTPLSTLSECVFPLHERHHHDWHVPATIDYQEVRNSISWTLASPSWLTCAYHLWLSGSAYFNSMYCTVTTDMFWPLLTLRWCVCPIHKQHSHGWHVPATFDYQEVRISISWTALHHHSWHVPASFESQLVRIFILWAAQSCLTCTCHFQFLGSAYFHFIRTITVEITRPLSTLSEYVFSF